MLNCLNCPVGRNCSVLISVFSRPKNPFAWKLPIPLAWKQSEVKLVRVNRALQIADYRLVTNATQFLRPLFECPPRSCNPVGGYVGFLKGVIVPLSSRINGAYIVLKWCPFSCIKGAVIVVKCCLTGTKTPRWKWQRTIIAPRCTVSRLCISRIGKFMH